MGKTKTEVHRFFCLKCGKEGIPLSRKMYHMKGSGHRKKLYCPWCKETLNHYECLSEKDVQEFKIKFAEGAFKDEAEESVSYVRSTRFR